MVCLCEALYRHLVLMYMKLEQKVRYIEHRQVQSRQLKEVAYRLRTVLQNYLD